MIARTTVLKNDSSLLKKWNRNSTLSFTRRASLWKLFGAPVLSGLLILTSATPSWAQTCEIEVLKTSQRDKSNQTVESSRSALEVLTGDQLPLIFDQGFLNAFRRFLANQSVEAANFRKRVHQMNFEQRQQLARELWHEILAEYLVHSFNKTEGDKAENAPQQVHEAAQKISLTVAEFNFHRQALHQLNTQPQKLQDAQHLLAVLIPTYTRYAHYHQVFRDHVPKRFWSLLKTRWNQTSEEYLWIAGVDGAIVGGIATMIVGFNHLLPTAAAWSILPLLPASLWAVKMPVPAAAEWLGNKAQGLKQKAKNTWYKWRRAHTKKSVQRLVRKHSRQSEKSPKDVAPADLRRDLQETEDVLEKALDLEEIQRLPITFDLRNPESIQTLGQELMGFLSMVTYRIPLLEGQGYIVDKTKPLQDMRNYFAAQRRGQTTKPITEVVPPFLSWLQSQQSKLSSVRHQIGDLKAILEAMEQKTEEMIDALRAAELAPEAQTRTPTRTPTEEVVAQQMNDKINSLSMLKKDIAHTKLLVIGHLERLLGHSQSFESILKQLHDYQMLRLQGEAQLPAQFETDIKALAENFVEI